MNDAELNEYLMEHIGDADVLTADGFSEAFLGIGWKVQEPFACYDRDKCIEILCTRDSMTQEEAEEFFEFNVAGAYAGKATPIFVQRPAGAK